MTIIGLKSSRQWDGGIKLHLTASPALVLPISDAPLSSDVFRTAPVLHRVNVEVNVEAFSESVNRDKISEHARPRGRAPDRRGA